MINLMFGVWLEDTFALKITGLGFASIVIGIADLGGEGLSTFVIDKLGKQRTIRIALVLTAAAALGVPLAKNSLTLTLAALFMVFLTFEVAFIGIMALSSEILPKARATLMASNVAAVSLGRGVGAIFAPLLYGIGYLTNGVAAVCFALIAFWLVKKIKVAESPKFSTDLPITMELTTRINYYIKPIKPATPIPIKIKGTSQATAMVEFAPGSKTASSDLLDCNTPAQASQAHIWR